MRQVQCENRQKLFYDQKLKIFDNVKELKEKYKLIDCQNEDLEAKLASNSLNSGMQNVQLCKMVSTVMVILFIQLIIGLWPFLFKINLNFNQYFN